MIREISKAYILPLLFLALGIVFLLLSLSGPLKDFGNYYYGSRMFLDGKFNQDVYTGIHYFNAQIASYGESDFFENYVPVPPFSVLFYAPFSIFKSLTAKFIFSSTSLLLFCISLYRLQAFVTLHSRVVYLLPFIFMYPLYNCIFQGQSYLLIAAMLLEIYISSEKNQVFYPSLLIALVISLKIFPGFIIFYFLIRKNYRIVVMSIIFLAAVLVLTYFVLPHGTVTYYFTEIVPRLFNNDVVGPYYHGNQSVYTALLQLFSYDEISNEHPLVNNALFVILFESLFIALILSILLSLKEKKNFLLYAVTLFSMILLSRYTTSYGMLLLLPIALMLTGNQHKPMLTFFILLCLVVSLNFTVGGMKDFPFLVNFLRLWGLLVTLLVILYVFTLKPDLKLFLMLLIPIVVFKYFSYPIQPLDYFQVQNTRGILYEIHVTGDSITLQSTLGDKDYKETFKVNGKMEQNPGLFIENNRIYYNKKLICATRDNKLNPFIYNSNSIVFMSDLNQAVRFYKLRCIPLRPE